MPLNVIRTKEIQYMNRMNEQMVKNCENCVFDVRTKIKMIKLVDTNSLLTTNNLETK